MDSNTYVVEKLTAIRLAELRAEQRRIALLGAARDARPGIAAALGVALVRLGRWLAPAETAGGGNAGVRVTR